ncbi:MAG: thioredoxin [Eubacterium sp.]|nr:thioredoxin [Eubacterium sp.]MBQ2054141.1 thioredoxin [Eubacterium sp.]MEE3398379.1 thioredoxin [Eubacterium sp.]
MAVQRITSAEFDELVLKNDKPVFVDFFATWCGPCKMMEPVLEKASEEVPDVDFVSIDTDEAEDLALSYGITNIPCMIFFKNGEEADRVVGAVPKQKIIDVVSK